MGQQQLLLIILSVIIVGIATAVGLSLFTAQAIEANKDAIINDISNLASNAYQFRIRPISMGGGGNSYLGSNGAIYTIPIRLRSDENGTYSVTVTANFIVITAVSAQNPTNTVTITIGSDGRPSSTWSYGGDFQ
ncbi:MAG: hypothetical protein WAV76_12085 [Bacteroidota bacterium]